MGPFLLDAGGARHPVGLLLLPLSSLCFAAAYTRMRFACFSDPLQRCAIPAFPPMYVFSVLRNSLVIRVGWSAVVQSSLVSRVATRTIKSSMESDVALNPWRGSLLSSSFQRPTHPTHLTFPRHPLLPLPKKQTLPPMLCPLSPLLRSRHQPLSRP